MINKVEIGLITCTLLGFVWMLIQFFTPQPMGIVVFDQQSILNQYYLNLKKSLDHSKQSNALTASLIQRNHRFIDALTHDVSSYQRKHHVMVVKQSALLTPQLLMNTPYDITPRIVKALQQQKVLS